MEKYNGMSKLTRAKNRMESNLIKPERKEIVKRRTIKVK